MRFPSYRLLPIFFLFTAAGCIGMSIGGGSPSQRYSIGELLLEVAFSNAIDWEAYSDPSIQVDGQIVGGEYRIEARDGGFMWALGTHVYRDSVLEVQTRQLSDYADNAYGVMCRADPSADGDGYYFFISGDGYYTIRRGVGDIVEDLIQWSPSSAIARGQAQNRIRAVCVGNYLALYVNDTFVDDYFDSRYSSGVVGLTAAVPEGGEVIVTFDNLLLFEAMPASP
jgi:hypothetical protein